MRNRNCFPNITKTVQDHRADPRTI
jgi:hypothetical protein